MDSSGKDLHDRFTRGATLSADESTALEAWYAQQDAEESVALSGPLAQEEITALRHRVEETLAALRSATHDLESQLAENEQLRAENAALRQRLPLTLPRA